MKQDDQQCHDYPQQHCQLCDDILDPFHSYAGIVDRMCLDCSQKQVSDYCEPIHKIIDGIYLGNEQGAKNQELLKEYDIQAICVCGCNLKIHKYETISPEVRVYQIYDVQKQHISQYFDRNNQFIKEMRDKNKNIFIHCAAGVSRSASFVIAYLMKDQHKTFLEALLAVKSKRKCVKPNPGFIEQLKNYQQKLKEISDSIQQQ